MFATPAAAVENVVAAAGTGSHWWCAVDGCSASCPPSIGAFAVTIDLVTGAGSIQGPSRCGFPGWEFAAGQCTGSPTGPVACVGFFGSTLSLSATGYVSFYSGLLVEHWVSAQLTRV